MHLIQILAKITPVIKSLGVKCRTNFWFSNSMDQTQTYSGIQMESNNRPTFGEHIELFRKDRNRDLLCCNLRGVEREALRVTARGNISHKKHPNKLGSALTHPLITTDYSEALLEFVTDPYPKIDDLLTQLGETHSFTAVNLEDDELLWPCSMPCPLDSDEDVPIAQYGTSNVGMMKTIYRRGLGHRYGRKMQAIAGVHFNFSVPDAVWSSLRTHSSSLLPLQDFKTDGYLKLVRNFRRRFWLLLYLMGASPVAHASFIKGREHDLEKMGTDDVYLPHATSLRMGDLGYQSTAQDALYVCYNSIQTYLETLQKAIVERYEPYEGINYTGNADQRQQLSAAVLQIENEFYSTIRPKQTARSGETQLKALKERGVEYIEVRCVDINPFEPLGIGESQIRFLEIFLLACLFDESPETNSKEHIEILANQRKVVREGRNPGLMLQKSGKSISLKNWADELLDQLAPVAEILDSLKGEDAYSSVLFAMKQKVNNPDLCPSAKLLEEMRQTDQTFIDWSINKAREHQQFYLQKKLSASKQASFEHLSEISLGNQKEIEGAENQSLENYIQNYFNQYRQL